MAAAAFDATQLPGRLANAVILTPASPLTERHKLCASPACVNVAIGLASYGYSVGWDNGLFQVSTVKDTRRPADAPAHLTLDTFMGAHTRKRYTYGYRPKVASSLTFTKGPALAAATQTLSASGHPVNAPAPRTPPQHAAPRFQRLTQSLDTLQSLQVPVAQNINHRNLINLARGNEDCRPQTPVVRPSTAPTTSQPRLQASVAPPEQPAARVQPGVQGWGEVGVVRPRTPGAVLRPATPTPAVAAVVSSRPSTPVVDLHKDASAALRPLTPGTPPLSRPYTARPSSTQGFNVRTFRPSRGHALVVFQHMDKDRNGKVTLSELEDACLGLGFSTDQALKFFNRLDKGGKGYLSASDWGDVDMCKTIELFTLAYMQWFMGLPSLITAPEQIKAYLRNEEVKAARSMGSALQMARANAILRGAHASTTSGNVIFEAFRFMDSNGSGTLSYEELRDGFYALGVCVKDDVMRQMMEYMDSNKDGTINYYEFVKRMFPTQRHAA